MVCRTVLEGLWCVGQYWRVYGVQDSIGGSMVCRTVLEGLWCVGQYWRVYGV